MGYLAAGMDKLSLANTAGNEYGLQRGRVSRPLRFGLGASNLEEPFCLARSHPVSGHDFPSARERISELIDSASTAVGQMHTQPDDAGSAFFTATWTTSRAAGFLEAFALVDPALAGDMLPNFESVARLVDQLRAAHEPGKRADVTQLPELLASLDSGRSAGDRRLTARPAGNIRRMGVRRSIAERRIEVRRQMRDRRAT